MPDLLFARTNIQGTQFVFEARIPHTNFAFQFPGTGYQAQVNSARGFVAALDNGGDLTHAEMWIFDNLAANPLNPAATWTRAEAIGVLRTMLNCDSIVVGGQALLVDAFVLAQGRALGAYDTLEEAITGVDGDVFMQEIAALMLTV